MYTFSQQGYNPKKKNHGIFGRTQMHENSTTTVRFDDLKKVPISHLKYQTGFERKRFRHKTSSWGTFYEDNHRKKTLQQRCQSFYNKYKTGLMLEHAIF